MLKSLLLTISAVLFSIIIQCQDRPDLAVEKIPFQLMMGADAVIRYDQSTFTVKNESQAVGTLKAAITRLNQDAPFDELRIEYDNFKKVEKIKATLYDANGKLVRKVKKNEIKDYTSWDGVSFFSDNRQKYLDLTYGRFPYTIVYEYEIVFDGLFGYPPWIMLPTYGVSLIQSEYSLTLPSELTFQYRAVNSNPDLEVREENSMKQYKWTISNLSPIPKEPYGPSGLDIFPALLITPDQFGIEEHSGSMSDWKAFGKFIFELNRNHNNLSPEFAAYLQRMIAHKKTDTEKIDTIYQYLKQNMRYVSVQLGIGGWKAFDAAYVEKNKYGDCKALTWFMKAMLEEAGIESFPALVMAGDEFTNTTLPEDFSFPRFNHVILNIPSENVWLECTSNYNPLNYLGSFTDNRPVLLITEEGGKLTQTPEITTEENSVKNNIHLTLENDGSAKLKNNSLLTGAKHDRYRFINHEYPYEKLEKWFLQSSKLPSFKINQLELQTSPKKPEVTLSYSVEIPKYASKTGKRIFVPVNTVNPFDNVPPAMDRRTHPVEIKRGYLEEDHIIIEFPENFRTESIPNEESISHPEFGQYSLHIEAKPGKLICRRRMMIRPVNLPPEKYQELREFYQQIAKADKAMLVLVEKKS